MYHIHYHIEVSKRMQFKQTNSYIIICSIYCFPSVSEHMTWQPSAPFPSFPPTSINTISCSMEHLWKTLPYSNAERIHQKKEYHNLNWSWSSPRLPNPAEACLICNIVKQNNSKNAAKLHSERPGFWTQLLTLTSYFT